MGDGAQRITESLPLARRFREQVASERQSSSWTDTFFRRRINNTNPAVSTPSDQTPTDGGANPIRDQPDSREEPPDLDPTKIHGFLRQALLLQQHLAAPDGKGFKCAAIFGVAGVGKTTLCQLVFNQVEVIREKYFPRIWVTLSSETANDTETVVKRLLEKLGVDEDIISSVRNLPCLLYTLFLQLSGKPYLVVLDGVGEADTCCQELRSCAAGNSKKWSDGFFSYGFPKGCGGAVLITTRSEEAAKKMAAPEGFLYHLRPLSDPESCWLIYKDQVLAPEGEASEEVKLELMNKSGGLPRALVMLREIKQAIPVDHDHNMINHVDVS